jgi:hypothetical protein
MAAAFKIGRERSARLLAIQNSKKQEELEKPKKPVMPDEMHPYVDQMSDLERSRAYFNKLGLGIKKDMTKTLSIAEIMTNESKKRFNIPEKKDLNLGGKKAK